MIGSIEIYGDGLIGGSGGIIGSLGDNSQQSISVTDLISEGPIEGLVDGQASVFLNDDRVVPLKQAALRASLGPMTITLDNGSKTAIISGNTTSTPILTPIIGDKYLVVKGIKKATVVATTGTTGATNGTPNVVLTSSSPIFDDEDVITLFGSQIRLSDLQGYTTIPTGLGQGYLAKKNSTTSAVYVPGDDGAAGLWLPSGSYTANFDKTVKIASINGTTITLEENWTDNPDGTPVDYKFDVTGAIVLPEIDEIDQTLATTYQGVTTQFRVGTLDQTPFSGWGGVGSTSISNNPQAGGVLEWTTGYGGVQDPKELIGSAQAGFNLSLAQLQTVDEAQITIAYPQFYAVNGKGDDRSTWASYDMKLAIKEIGAGDFNAPISINPNILHRGMYKNSHTEVQIIDLTKYRPFADFKVIISRKTDHQGDGYSSPTKREGDWQNATSASISTTTCIIKEILTHPYSAVAKVTFGSKQFQGMPARTYHARGIRVQVPSNYTTREETASNTAFYNRDVETGEITSTYQDWDGEFRPEKIYTNNPAWVFYDILTNDRYGLGDFLSALDIDKYSLYRIGRYCDELVLDGKGGYEPRFTANLYLTKQADAYKVLKDVATIFRSMIYYLNGEIVPIMDAPSGPVYNFSKSNVIGGFNYEGTGSKTRVNQVIVSWMNPLNNYKLEPLIVEDRLSIAETGTIIAQQAVAFGCTSEGQAMRYGRWKLWTAANQKEVVTFRTALNASFLVPGDVINIQDADRYAVRYSGRVSNSGTTRTTTSVPIDSPVTLNSGSTYELAILIIEPAAFATQDVVINGVTTKQGELLEQAFLWNDATSSYTLQNIDTKEKSLHAKISASAQESIVLSWSEYTRVESQSVVFTAGVTSTIVVDTAFSVVPSAETIWVLTESNTAGVVASSAKEYKILAMAQDSKNEFTITACEYYNAKFDAIEVDFTTYIADTVYPPITATDDVPSVLDVFGVTQLQDGAPILTIHWTAPEDYAFIQGYEIHHNFGKGYENPIRILDRNTNFFTFKGVQHGDYKVAVRVINSINNLSEPAITNVTITNKYDSTIPRLPEGVPYQGTISTGTDMAAGIFKFKKYNWTGRGPDDGAALISNSSNTLAAWQQDCTGLPIINWTEQAHSGEFVLEHAYVLMDASDTADRLKLIKYHKPTNIDGSAFWYNINTGENTNKFGGALTGSFSKAAKSSKVTGSGTAFLTQIQEGDVLKLGSEQVRVSSVLNDTTLYLTSATAAAFSGLQGYIPNIRIDYTNDCIIARIYRTSAGYFAYTYAKVDGQLKIAGDIVTAHSVTENEISLEGNFGTLVASLGTFDVVDTGLLDADSVIAREIQVFPEGGAAPTISGTTLTGAGIDLKQDGDLYVGDFSADKYMFWDQSEGVMTFRGSLDASDINAGFISADRIETGSLSADVITAGTIQSVHIQAGSIQADDIGVANLSSINANIGAITAGTIRGNTMPDADTAPAGAETGAFLDLTGGKMVFGNADKFILWDGTDLTISGVTINAAQLTGSTGFATAGYVDDSIAALIDSAPGTLDTLNELAAAIGDNQNFATDVAASIGAKLPKAGGEMTGNITFSSTQTVDGRDVSVDGTKLDTIAPGATNTAAPYYTSAIPVGDGGLTQNNFTTTLKNKLDGVAAGATNTAAPYYTAAIPNATSSVTGLMTSTFATKLDGIAPGATNVTNNNQITNGAGYITNADGGDAATFGGSLPSEYLKTDSAQALGNVTNALTNNGSIITLTRGDGTTDVVTVPNTTYNVGDGGLTQKNFTTTLKDKLDGIATGATNTAAPYYTSAIPVGDGGLTQNNFTTTLKNKLDGIPSNANYYEFPYTINTAASANTVVRRDANGYIFGNYINMTGSVPTTGGASTIGSLSGSNGSDNYLRGFDPASVRTFLNVADGANNYSHPQEGVDFGAALTGANVISDVAVNANGHVTGFTSRALTLGNLGYTANVAATGNSLVQRNASGYVYASYFNTTPDTVTSGVTQICVETGNDGWIRHGTAAAVRSFLNVADGATASTSGVTSISSTSSGLTVTGGTTATPSLALHANLQNLSAAGAIDGTLRVGVLRADTVFASYIESNEIKSVHLEISKDTGADRIHMDGANNCIKVYANNVLRVKIGNLA